MSPPNLDRLLVLPTGCGEQNMVKTSINMIVGTYLENTEQLSAFIAVKIRKNIDEGGSQFSLFTNVASIQPFNNSFSGYQRQLTYLQSSGCFSVWQHGECSLWSVYKIMIIALSLLSDMNTSCRLTAYAVSVLSAIHSFKGQRLCL